eukprot:TRINITY_DN4466_c0_g1_i1.p1 TRINITY_DN4466_c0_g1~~TRINITY_DN4466_c0_g1_i1.p1  ORF type:complete len:595 (-),score=73.16 TRINITY_DN4466_c0_g1_i1:6-1790(-)
MAQRGNDSSYDLKDFQLPIVRGRLTQVMAALTDVPVLGNALLKKMLRDGEFTRLIPVHVEEEPTFEPVPSTSFLQNSTIEAAAALPPPSLQPAVQLEANVRCQRKDDSFRFRTIQDFHSAYQSGASTPTKIATEALSAIERSNATTPPLRAVIMTNREEVLRQAEASELRWRARAPLGLLDGVPIAVKNEIDVTPFPTTGGTSWIHTVPEKDATVIRRLRDHGAVIIGITNMHEIGLGVTGANWNDGFNTCRNPYNVNHDTAGSSSGSAASVGAGICPVAIGADGGGSVRLPAAFNGAVGLKPTFARVSEAGAFPLTWTLGHIGPIAASAADAAIVYAIIAGPDPAFPVTQRQPTLPTLEGIAEISSLRGIRLGVYEPWFNHCDAVVRNACHQMLRNYEQLGASIDYSITIPQLSLFQLAHICIISSEIRSSMESFGYFPNRKKMNPHVRISLALAGHFTTHMYIQSHRLRTRALRVVAAAFERVDAILTPAAAVLPPPYPNAAYNVEINATKMGRVMRYAPFWNFTGNPAITFPVGYDVASNLPIAMQVATAHWNEALCLRLAGAAELFVQRRKPQVHFDLLGDTTLATSASM